MGLEEPKTPEEFAKIQKTNEMKVSKENLNQVAEWFADELKSWEEEQRSNGSGIMLLEKVDSLCNFILNKLGFEDVDFSEVWGHSVLDFEEKTSYENPFGDVGATEGTISGVIKFMGKDVIHYGSGEDNYGFKIEEGRQDLISNFSPLLSRLIDETPELVRKYKDLQK